jgi:formylglycine-generating enzyme required for sulfatase activity/serine/threonine protein kinase
MPTDDASSLNDEQTFEGGAQPANSSDRSLGDQSTFGGGGESSLSDIGGLTGDADLDMEIVDLSRYEVQETLGKGGMGEVLLATDTRLNRKVAIKRMLGDAVKSQTAVKRFLTEAQSIAALNHFNIVQIHDYGRDKDGPFLIMEYVGGGSLLDKCGEGALPLEEAIELTCQLCDGLEMAHDAGIIHRDIKPANILLTTDGLPKLTDFGLARQDTGDTGQTMAGAVLGTLDFMPPEQRRDATETDARSDLWALAATLYQMVTGEPPRVIDLDAVPQELRSCLAQALKQKQDARFQTAAEFRDALRATAQTASQPTSEPAADLGTGECPKCHDRNEANRKFCRGCGSSLRFSCLSCDEQIPVWDNFCSECGGNQLELVASKLEDFDSERDQAEDHRREYQFENALYIARSLASVKDERITEHVPWAEEFVTATEAEWERERESAAVHFDEARKHRDAFDYASAIHAVESVPEAMRTSEMSGYLQRLESDCAESEELTKTISDRVKRRDLKGLLEQVERSVELRGDRADLRKLQDQLRERKAKRQQQRQQQCEEACAEATRLFGTGDAKGALAMIQSVPSEYLRSSDEQLRSQLEEIIAAEDNLTALVKESKADGVLDPDEVVSMWQATVSYLELNSRHEKIAGMQQQLEARIQKAPAKYAAFAVLADFWPTQPASVLSQLPANVLTQLPANVLLQLPPRKNSIGMEFKLLPGGTFTMGDANGQNKATPHQATPHQVTLTKAFELGVYEVTQEQYEQVIGSNPSNFKGPQNPVEQVSWDDAVEFCRRLSAVPAEKAAGYVYRLPTEAEWECACRAGTTTEYSFGDSELELGDYAWFGNNSGDKQIDAWKNREADKYDSVKHVKDVENVMGNNLRAHPIGGKKPNAWGLYDMHGNVCEWCQDRYGDYPSGAVADPTGAANGSDRVNRGGSHFNFAWGCRSAYRYGHAPDVRDDRLGCRVLRSSIK